MKQLSIDCGVEEFCINGRGVLRFNPSDPNLYTRFLALEERLPALEEELKKHVEAMKQEEHRVVMLHALEQADRQLKDWLTEVFGSENDFHQLLEGVNLLAVAQNGQAVVVNLLGALEPILTEGVERFAESQTRQAVEQARQRRSML